MQTPNEEASRSNIEPSQASGLPTPPTAGAAATGGAEEMGPIERASLAAHLNLISQRLAQVDERLRAKPADGTNASKPWLEFFKVLLGGWPAFGLLFMLLFYVPVRDAINAIPEKVKSADEIGVLGVSLKNTIRAEAEKVGAIQLSETLPSLSPAAVEFLLRGSREYNSLVGYSYDDSNARLMKAIWLPSEQTLKILQELEDKKLVAIRLDPQNQDETVVNLKQAIEAFRKKNPSREEGYSGSDQIRLELQIPISDKPPNFSWRPTDLGKNAVNIILKAVSAQLSPRPKTQEAAKK